MSKRSTLLLSGIAAVGANLAMKLTSAPMKTYNIVAFEFAHTLENANCIMSEWGEAGMAAARLNIWIDFGFIAAYVVFGATLLRGLGGRTGDWFARGFVLAGILDVLENLCMLQTLSGNTSAFYPQAAFWLAAVKFSLVGLGLLYGLFMALKKVLGKG